VRSRGNDPKVGGYVTSATFGQASGAKSDRISEYHLGNVLQGQNSHRHIQWPGGFRGLESDMKCIDILGYLKIY
jgi:hypothetical protein